MAADGQREHVPQPDELAGLTTEAGPGRWQPISCVGFGQALIAIFGVMTLVFFIQRLTGDPTYLLVPETATTGRHRGDAPRRSASIAR